MGELLTDNINNKASPIVDSLYKLDDLLIHCSFNTRLCYRNLTKFFYPSYGNCYTFNNDEHVEPIRRNDTSHFRSIDDEDVEDDYKLFLELFLYQNEYIPSLDDRAAFRLFIHRKNQIPILSQNSLFLAPTTFTKLIFSQRIISFSQQCRNDLTDDMKQIFNPKYTQYSQALCLKLCEFRFVEKVFRCTDRLFMIYVQFFTRNETIQMNTDSSCPEGKKCLTNPNCFSKYFELTQNIYWVSFLFRFEKRLSRMFTEM